MSTGKDQELIKVCVRIRPPTEAELAKDSNVNNGLIEIDPPTQNSDGKGGTQSMTLKPGGNDRSFVMDSIFGIEASQKEVYERSAKSIVDSVLLGFNGAVLAYGQTNSGKTYTMEGPSTTFTTDNIRDDEMARETTVGIIPRMVGTLFQYIDNAGEYVEFLLQVSMLEIYNERLRDLLDTSKINLKIREDKKKGIFVEHLTEWFVTTPQEIFECLRKGQINRTTASTNMNLQSSRSHMIFFVTVHQRNKLDLTTKTGKLYLVDLAGSEKVGKTGAEGQTLDEAKMINKSLSCLGNVIYALTSSTALGIKQRAHIPFRDSKLTRVLEETLGGNSKTCLICTISPSYLNESETLSTLRFGQRAKLIKNVAVINEGRSIEALELLLSEAEDKLKQQSLYIQLLENNLKEAGLSLPKENKIIKNSSNEHRIFSSSTSSDSSEDELADRPKNTEIGHLKDDIIKLKNRFNGEELSESAVSNPSFRIVTNDEDVKMNQLKHQLKVLNHSLNEEKEKTNALRSLFQSTDIPLEEKLNKVDSHLQKLTQMYQNLIEKNAGLKLDCRTKAEKLEIKDRWIQKLELNLEKSRAQYKILVEEQYSSSLNSFPIIDFGVGTQSENSSPIEVTNEGLPPCLDNHHVESANVSKRLNIIKPLQGGGRSSSSQTSSKKHSFLAALVGSSPENKKKSTTKKKELSMLTTTTTTESTTAQNENEIQQQQQQQ